MSAVTLQTNQASNTTTLSFILSGQDGTTGYGNITIPKSAIPYGAKPTIYIDGIEAQNQSYTEDTYYYYVNYITHFSTHGVSIVFKTDSVSQTEYLLWIILSVIAVIVAVLATVILIHHKRAQKQIVCEKVNKVAQKYLA